jgi:hypothetical protein
VKETLISKQTIEIAEDVESFAIITEIVMEENAYVLKGSRDAEKIA